MRTRLVTRIGVRMGVPILRSLSDETLEAVALRDMYADYPGPESRLKLELIFREMNRRERRANR